MTSWSCQCCTYCHESAKEQQFLRCAVCAAPKTATNATATGRDPSRRQESSSKVAAVAIGRSHQKRQGNLLQHFGNHKKAGAKRAKIESKPTTPKIPSRSILDALKPQRASSFAPPARYRDNPKDDWRAIDNDGEIEKLCPMTLVRDALPSLVASRLLEQLQGEVLTWNQGKWIVFGKEHLIPRTTATYNLSSPAGKNQSDSDVQQRQRPDPRHNDNQAIEDEEDDEYLDDQRPISPELRIAAQYVADHVKRHCPWTATTQNQGWEPTFAFANCYASGQDCVGWHSDHITPLGPRPIIVGLTLGACRRFELRQQVDTKKAAAAKINTCRHVSVPLPHNSLCIMWNDAQESWQHSVPRCSDDAIMKHSKVGMNRISLTFRKRIRIPDQGNCYCGRPAGLKAKDGHYYLFCKPYGKGKRKTCNFWKPCPWAEAEAVRLVALETSGRGNTVVSDSIVDESSHRKCQLNKTSSPKQR